MLGHSQSIYAPEGRQRQATSLTVKAMGSGPTSWSRAVRTPVTVIRGTEQTMLEIEPIEAPRN
jgi:hypothetical protein